MPRPLRVLVIAMFHGDYSTELSSALAAAGARVTLLLDDEQAARDCGAEQLAAFGKVGRLVTVSRRGAGKVTAVMKMIAAAILTRADLCIIHGHFNPYLVGACRVIARLCALYVIVHDPVPHVGRDAAMSVKAVRADRDGRALAHAFLVHGAFCRRLLLSTGQVGGRPVLDVTHGPILRPMAGNAPATPPEALMFGRMEAYKGLAVLLDALRLLAARGRPARCRIMGRGPELDRLEGAFREVGAEITNGFIPRDTIIDALGRAAFLVAPYSEATQSGVVAAAFASGRPVVASAVGGLVDAVTADQDGLLVPGGDPQALADALDRMATDGALRDRLSAGAARTAATTLDWGHFAARLLAFHRRATAHGRWSPGSSDGP